jgi:anti-anti-sigma factor
MSFSQKKRLPASQRKKSRVRLASAVNILNPDEQTSVVTNLPDLTAINPAQIRDDIRAALPPTCTRLVLDFASQPTVDSRGLGLLIALHKTLRSRCGSVALRQPAATVRQILELTHLDRLFAIVP